MLYTETYISLWLFCSGNFSFNSWVSVCFALATSDIIVLIFFLFLEKSEQFFKHLFTEVHSDKYKNLAQGLVLAQNYRQPQKITPNNVKLFLF